MKGNRIRAVFVCGLFALSIGLLSGVRIEQPSASTAQVSSAIDTSASSQYTIPIPPPPTPPPTDTNDGDDTNIGTTEPLTSPVVTSTTQDEYRACPFPQEPNRTTIDFTKGTTYPTRLLAIRANGSSVDAHRELPANVSPGIYRVESASYSSLEVAETVASGSGSGQRWYGVLLNTTGTVVGETLTTHDPDPGELVKEILDDSFEVYETVYSIHAWHDAYPAQTAHAVIPLCLSFVRTGSLPSAPQTVTNTFTATTTTATSATTSTVSGPVTCPIPAREGRTVIDFTDGGSKSYDALVLYAQGTKDAALTDAKSITLSPGTYEVRYASLVQAGTRTSSEFWRGVLTDNTGGTVLLPLSREVPDWESEYVSKLDQPITITREVRRVAGLHGTYPNSTPSPIVPLCISFERLDAFSVQETAPTTETQPPPPDIPVPATSAIPYGTKPHDTLEPTVTVQSPSQSTDYGTPMPYVTVKAEEVGIYDGRVDLVVPEDVAYRRAMFLKEHTQTLFETLHDASPRERARLTVTLRDDGRESSTTLPLVRPLREGTQDYAVDDNRTDAAGPVFKRGGLVALRDRDGDGVSDYDEEHLYDTDPDNAFTAGDMLSDGERLILGLDPTTTDTAPIPVESPRDAGILAPHLLVVESIRMETAEEEGVPASSTSPLTIVGTGQPLAFLTIYIFSTPIIITVRTDASGRFEYTLNETLSDGSHELYVASVNNSGKILAKSQPLPFIKTAQAIEYTPPIAPSTDPVQGSLQYMLTFGLLAVLLIAVGTITWIGMYRVRRDDDGVAQNTNETGTL